MCDVLGPPERVRYKRGKMINHLISLLRNHPERSLTTELKHTHDMCQNDHCKKKMKKQSSRWFNKLQFGDGSNGQKRAITAIQAEE